MRGRHGDCDGGAGATLDAGVCGLAGKAAWVVAPGTARHTKHLYKTNRAAQKSTMRCSAQKRSLPACFEMKPQWPPRSGATNWMAGFALILADRNEL